MSSQDIIPFAECVDDCLVESDITLCPHTEHTIDALYATYDKKKSEDISTCNACFFKFLQAQKPTDVFVNWNINCFTKEYSILGLFVFDKIIDILQEIQTQVEKFDDIEVDEEEYDQVDPTKFIGPGSDFPDIIGGANIVDYIYEADYLCPHKKRDIQVTWISEDNYGDSHSIRACRPCFQEYLRYTTYREKILWGIEYSKGVIYSKMTADDVLRQVFDE